MPRRVSLVVLHEDTLHQSFVAAFLNASTLPARGRPRFVLGGNRAGVVARFPTEAMAMRSAGGETHLIVVMDADGESYDVVRRRLLLALPETARNAVDQDTRWLVVSPAWEMENWIHNLEGREVSEARDLGLTLERDSECRSAARKLADHCMRGEPIPNGLPSLVQACAEWRRYLERNDL